ncbi:MAG: hypothetical protein JWM80_205 [Cyanobacteria bacterium RYN_339]|nr:hypothetical protein [Cyanobacteria bacterium RYN_339]
MTFRAWLAGLAGFWALGGAPPAPELNGLASWACYYGADAPIGALQGPDLLVLEPDHAWQPAKIRRPGQKILAYLSLGEVHSSRPYIGRLEGALLPANPDWPDARRVNPGAPAWKALVLDELAPALLERGFDGFFLDTLDAAEDLEAKKVLPGAKAAMTNLVLALHAKAPKALIVANRGLALLPRMAPAISAIAVESIFTEYQFKPAKYAWRNAAQARAFAAELQGLKRQYRLPILGLEYVDDQDTQMRGKAAALLAEGGFVPSVAEIGLSEPPRMAP